MHDKEIDLIKIEYKIQFNRGMRKDELEHCVIHNSGFTFHIAKRNPEADNMTFTRSMREGKLLKINKDDERYTVYLNDVQASFNDTGILTVSSHDFTVESDFSKSGYQEFQTNKNIYKILTYLRDNKLTNEYNVSMLEIKTEGCLDIRPISMVDCRFVVKFLDGTEQVINFPQYVFDNTGLGCFPSFKTNDDYVVTSSKQNNKGIFISFSYTDTDICDSSHKPKGINYGDIVWIKPSYKSNPVYFVVTEKKTSLPRQSKRECKSHSCSLIVDYKAQYIGYDAIVADSNVPTFVPNVLFFPVSISDFSDFVGGHFVTLLTGDKKFEVGSKKSI